MSIYSKEHELFLKKAKRKRCLIYVNQILIICLLFTLWEILSRLNIINSFLFSSPSNIIKTISNLIKENNFFTHVLITIKELSISFILSLVFGFLIATILWWNEFLAKVIDPYLTVLNSLPKVALGPLIIIWIGASSSSIITMSLMISLFITIINLYTSFINTDENYIFLLKSFKATKFQIYTKVILNANLKNILSTIKINISMNLIGLMVKWGENILKLRYLIKYLYIIISYHNFINNVHNYHSFFFKCHFIPSSL